MPQKLLTQDIVRRLRANAVASAAAPGGSVDHKPVLKLFNPAGSGTWLFTELEEDGDTLFGLGDPGQGSPELGRSSLRELTQFRDRRFRLPLERDAHFNAKAPLSAYTAAARAAGRIVEDLQ